MREERERERTCVKMKIYISYSFQCICNTEMLSARNIYVYHKIYLRYFQVYFQTVSKKHI